ncbi:MFS transporter [Streptomyces phaeoluteigriseus]|uniref:MFS transporter n=1 Tax=Streptomyces phaeoluteigriseus TaxID=114686 RepID=UPI000A419D53
MPAPAAPPARDHAGLPAVRGRLPAVLLMTGSCLPVLGAVLLAPVLPRMQDHFEGVTGSAALVPLVLTVPALSLALLAPFAGVVVDRLGRKRLLVAATVLYALFGTLPLWLDSLHGILLSRVLVGVAEAVIMTACTTLIGDYYSGRSATATSPCRPCARPRPPPSSSCWVAPWGRRAGGRPSGSTRSACSSPP